MSNVEERLRAIGLTVPPVVMPLAAYVPAVRTGDLVYTAGQVPMVDGELAAAGRLGDGISLEEGAALARICALNGLAAVKSVVGDLDRVVRVVKVVGFVASTPDFTSHPAVVNGESNLLKDVFGEAGVHARSAVGVAALPLGAPVEVEMIVEVAD